MSQEWLDALDPQSPFGLEALPFGVVLSEGRGPRLAVRLGEQALDLAAVSATTGSPHANLFDKGTLDPLLASGRAVWHEVREEIAEWLTSRRRAASTRPHLLPLAGRACAMPFSIADYVDFYSSEHHAANLGRLFRPGADPLPAAWKHLPIGYHGRAGTVVVSGTPVVRPSGVRLAGDPAEARVGPSEKLDFEAEVGFVVGVPSELGIPVPIDRFEEHVFGVLLVNDWSARDIQAFESVPLGPFLGKSFLTTISAWVLPLQALEAARLDQPPKEPAGSSHLAGHAGHAGHAGSGYAIELEVRLNGSVLSRPPFETMYWSAAEQLAHMTSNGASLRTGDLFASGTVSGPAHGQYGSLLELSWNGTQPVELEDGSTRRFLLDGDEVAMTATAPAPSGCRLGLGEVTGRVLPARPTRAAPA